MATGKPTPAAVASDIQRILRDGGSAEHAKGVQWFFKEEIKSHGWYTAALRKAALRSRREIRKEFGLDFLVRVADRLFSGEILEEKSFAVFLLEKLTAEFRDAEFKLFESWLGRIKQLGRSRRTGALLDCAHDRCEAGSRGNNLPLGQVPASLAPPGRVRGGDPRCTPADVFP